MATTVGWTPGPWHEFAATVYGPDSLDDGSHETTDRECIAREVSRANGRLIAAAPELAATLRRMLDYFAPDCDSDCRVPDHGPAHDARALLARIKGMEA